MVFQMGPKGLGYYPDPACAAAPGGKPAPRPLPPLWRPVLDLGSNSVYYWNMQTDAVAWDRPNDADEPGPAVQRPSTLVAVPAAVSQQV